MEWSVFLPDRSREIKDVYDLLVWLNSLAYRWFQGHWRYGDPHRRNQYSKRILIELVEYEKTGNCEHLRNVAVYAYLESKAPSNPKFHDNNFADSATRQFMES